MHQTRDQATDRVTNQSTDQASRAKNGWRSAAKAGARWLIGCMRRMSTRTVKSAGSSLPRVRKNSHATNLASKAVASSSAISTRTLSRAVWLRSSRWVVLRRFRLTVQRPVLKAASPVGSAVRLAVRATQAVDGRAWRRPIHRALRITHTVSMALMGLTIPLESHRAPPKPHAACRRSRRLATSTYCNLMAAYRN
jgi:hypothetical protein